MRYFAHNVVWMMIVLALGTLASCQNRITDGITDGTTCACAVDTQCCDGCVAINEGGSCSDGTYCNGTETCSAGACGASTGNPCPARVSTNNDCTQTCSETQKNCSGNDPDQSICIITNPPCNAAQCNNAGTCVCTTTIPPPFTLTSTAFINNAAIPAKHAGSGQGCSEVFGVSPQLSWTYVPADTQSFALIIEDLDAAASAGSADRWIHWVRYNIPAGTTTLAEGYSTPGSSVGTGKNSWSTPTQNDVSYRGPCPPSGNRTHHYTHTLYAVSKPLNFNTPNMPPTAVALKTELDKTGVTLGTATLIGTYPNP